MEQFVALIRERDWENAVWTDYFIVSDSDNPEQNFRDAIKEFLMTPEGIQQIIWTNGDYNWGDVMNSFPSSIWRKHNIRPVSEGEQVTISSPIEIIVDQDEVLIPEEYYDSEEV